MTARASDRHGTPPTDHDSTRQGEVVDVVVLGGGPVGENVAQYATQGSGLSATLVEGELLGGECSYYACMPSKALLRPVEIAADAAHLDGVSTPTIDVDALLERRDVWVSRYDDSGQVAWARGAGLGVVRGHGRISGEREVTVESADGPRVLRARHAVVVATGSSPVVPPVYADVAPWGSRDATGVREVPARLIIVGGGVVACEAAVWMAALGSAVTLLVRGSRVLPRVEDFAADVVLDALRASGVDVRLRADVVACRRDDAADTGVGRIHGGPVTVTIAGSGDAPGDADERGDQPGGGQELVADEILVAVGRRPRLDDVGLSSVGLDAADVLAGRLPQWLHAVGDAAGDPPTTHWGKYRARLLGDRLARTALAGHAAAGHAAGHAADQHDPGVEAPVPQVVFTDPQVAAVGPTADEARAAGARVVVARVPWTAAAGAGLLRDDATGGAMLVVDADTGRVLGATFVGPGAGELLHAATIAITSGAPVSTLWHAVPCYPTASELWLRLLEALPRELVRPQTAQSRQAAQSLQAAQSSQTVQSSQTAQSSVENEERS